MNNSAPQPLEPQRIPAVPYSMVDVLRLVRGFPSFASLSVLQTDVLFRGRGSCCAPGLATHGPALQGWGSHCHPVSASYLSPWGWVGLLASVSSGSSGLGVLQEELLHGCLEMR